MGISYKYYYCTNAELISDLTLKQPEFTLKYSFSTQSIYRNFIKLMRNNKEMWTVLMEISKMKCLE